ncbi:baseplate J/gp47 family protein [Humitalea sp. 24SJ18S-53]|uniref:baseplate J/gp47 family protein n=1 Tax=Humitalea sp. 24SJ18S-53 TaxID=3422307 RepID=UPI003D67E683
MTWPVQTPEAIAERIAARIEQAFPGTDPRSNDTALGVLTAAVAMELFDVHLFQQIVAREAMVDTADAWLERHANTWGTQRVPATRAAGLTTFLGADGTVIPAGTALRAGDLAFSTTTLSTIGVGGSLDVAVQADAPGIAGNLVAGVTLTLVSPIAGLSAQSAVVAAPGLSGGAGDEGDEALRARVLARIRRPPMGGRVDDYVAWARSASADIALVSVIPLHLGLGTVGVIVAMTGPRAPTGPELALVVAAIEAERPVTAAVTVLGATTLAVNITLSISPDNSATRAAATAALAAFFLAEGAIGATMPLSRISEALSSANGEYSHILTAPAAAVVPTATQVPVLGTVTFT